MAEEYIDPEEAHAFAVRKTGLPHAGDLLMRAVNDFRIRTQHADHLGVRTLPGGATVWGSRSILVGLHAEDVRAWVAALCKGEPFEQGQAKPSGAHGRSYDLVDAPIVAKMQALIIAGKAKSRNAAAWAVIGRDGSGAEGASPESVVSRLIRRHKKAHPSFGE